MSVEPGARPRRGGVREMREAPHDGDEGGHDKQASRERED